MLEIIINSFWFILPAYCSNFFPLLLNGKRPLDFGKKFIDGQRLFGKGKTIEGFFGGFLFGCLVGSLQIYIWGIIQIGSFQIINHTPTSVFLLSFGAIFGDLIGSFIKRRFKIKSGEPAPILDQLDFLIFAIMLTSIFMPINILYTIFLIFITPFIHYLSNLVAFFLKVKDRPW